MRAILDVRGNKFGDVFLQPAGGEMGTDFRLSFVDALGNEGVSMIDRKELELVGNKIRQMLKATER